MNADDVEIRTTWWGITDTPGLFAGMTYDYVIVDEVGRWRPSAFTALGRIGKALARPLLKPPCKHKDCAAYPEMALACFKATQRARSEAGRK